jgi:hypothetical protein
VDAFFNANPTIQLEKLKGSKQLLYTTDDYPAFVDATGKGLYFPTGTAIAISVSLRGGRVPQPRRGGPCEGNCREPRGEGRQPDVGWCGCRGAVELVQEG